MLTQNRKTFVAFWYSATAYDSSNFFIPPDLRKKPRRPVNSDVKSAFERPLRSGASDRCQPVPGSHRASKGGERGVHDRRIARLSFVTSQKRPFLSPKFEYESVANLLIARPRNGAALACCTRELPFSSVRGQASYKPKRKPPVATSCRNSGYSSRAVVVGGWKASR